MSSHCVHIKRADHVRVPRAMVVTLALLLLYASVIVHLNDMPTHMLKVQSVQEAYAVEHLEAHDHLNILFPSEEVHNILKNLQVFLLPLSVFPFLAIFVCSIDHPPKYFPVYSL